MICRRCGAVNSDTARFCARCGQEQLWMPTPPPLPRKLSFGEGLRRARIGKGAGTVAAVGGFLAATEWIYATIMLAVHGTLAMAMIVRIAFYVSLGVFSILAMRKGAWLTLIPFGLFFVSRAWTGFYAVPSAYMMMLLGDLFNPFGLITTVTVIVLYLVAVGTRRGASIACAVVAACVLASILLFWMLGMALMIHFGGGLVFHYAISSLLAYVGMISLCISVAANNRKAF